MQTELTDDLDFVNDKVLRKFVDDLIKSGITVKKEIMNADTLKPSIRSPNRNKILQIISDIKNDSYKENDTTLHALPIITSKDKYILHGQHRWYAHKHLQMPVMAYVFSENRDVLFDIFANHKDYDLYKRIDKSRNIRIGKIAYSILEELSTTEGQNATL